MQNNLIPPRNNIIKYKTPYRVTNKADLDKITSTKAHKRSKTTGDQKSSKSKDRLETLISRTVEETEEILNMIMPPLRYIVDGTLYVQEISSCPATRPEVLALQTELDKLLESRQAKLTGICPIRRELYDQVFDEIIREITINCAERGLLLLRVRNEIALSLGAYQSVYESGVVFGLQKALSSEQEKQKKEQKIIDLRNTIYELEKQLKLEEMNCDAIEEKELSKLHVINKKAEEDINFLTKNHDQLKTQLQDILSQFK